MPLLSEVDCRDDDIFDGVQRSVVVERIVETLLDEMRQIRHPESHTLALVARQWTLTVMRQKDVPADVAADVAGAVATRIRGAFQGAES